MGCLKITVTTFLSLLICTSILLILKRLASFSLANKKHIQDRPAHFFLHFGPEVQNALEKRLFGIVWVTLFSLGQIIEAEGRRKIKNYDIAVDTANVNLGGGAIQKWSITQKTHDVYYTHFYLIASFLTI